MDFTEIGDRIRKIRKDLKMTREEFADFIEINPYAVGRIERGERKIMDIETLQKITNSSGISIDELINGSLDSKKDNTIKRINHLLASLSENELEYICDDLYRLIQFMHSESK